MADHVDPYRLYVHYPQARFDAFFDADETVASNLPSSKDLDDFYKDEAKDVHRELKRLFGAFRTEIYFARRHFAPSASWRDEIATRPSEVPVPQRFVVRVHLFELSHNGQPGRYLGFVSLRPPGTMPKLAEGSLAAKYALRYVIDAELGLPAYMQRPRYHLLTTTAAAPRLGVLPFRSAVYSAAGPSEERGAACVHLAVSQALHLIMGRFGCRPISQVEFELHLWKARQRAEVRGRSIGQVSEIGARLNEALKVIRRSCSGGGFQMTVEPRMNAKKGEGIPHRLHRDERVLAARFLTDALSCGLPVIAFVRAGHLIQPDGVQDIKNKSKNPLALLDTPHAVLVLGMHLLHRREEFLGAQSGTQAGAGQDATPPDEEQSMGWEGREDRAELPGRLIIHDALSRGPYFECMMSDFLDAAEATYDGVMRAREEAAVEEGESPPEREFDGVHLLVVGPEKMRLGHHQARYYAQIQLRMLLHELRRMDKPLDKDAVALLDYLHEVRVPRDKAEKAEDWLLICRLLSTPEVRSRYDRQGLTASYGDLTQLKQSYYWVVEIRHPQAGRSQSTDDPVLGPADQTPAMVLLWDCQERPPRRDDNPVKGRNHIGVSPGHIVRFTPAPPASHAQPA